MLDDEKIPVITIVENELTDKISELNRIVDACRWCMDNQEFDRCANRLMEVKEIHFTEFEMRIFESLSVNQ